MKALPCKTPGCGGHPKLPGSAVLKDGSPYLIGRSPAFFPHPVYCSACKRKTIISRTDWNLLPELTREDLARVAPPDDSHYDFKALTRSRMEPAE